MAHLDGLTFYLNARSGLDQCFVVSFLGIRGNCIRENKFHRVGHLESHSLVLLPLALEGAVMKEVTSLATYSVVQRADSSAWHLYLGRRLEWVIQYFHQALVVAVPGFLCEDYCIPVSPNSPVLEGYFGPIG